MPLLLTAGAALANSDIIADSVVDRPLPDTTQLSQKDLEKQVKKEQRELAKQDKQQLKQKAEEGERLAQVVLGSDFAEEAQMLTFAPAAANDASSDALRWYSLAAQRGFPGAVSLDTSGVSFFPVRVVRNQ